MKKITIEDKGFKLRVKQEDSPTTPMTLHKRDRISLVYTVDVPADLFLDPVLCDHMRAYMVRRLEEQIEQVIAKAREDIACTI